MTGKHRAAERHASAALQHKRAAHCHREASKHQQSEIDYAEVAELALAAHGQALRATEHASDAANYRTTDGGDRRLNPPKSALPDVEKRDGASRDARVTVSRADHHGAAADHHEQAARHHAQASKHCDDREYRLAVRESRFAHGHTQQSAFHDDEAARHHREHPAKARLIAKTT